MKRSTQFKFNPSVSQADCICLNCYSNSKDSPVWTQELLWIFKETPLENLGISDSVKGFANSSVPETKAISTGMMIK